MNYIKMLFTNITNMFCVKSIMHNM